MLFSRSRHEGVTMTNTTQRASAVDRCDRCGAQAFIHAEFSMGSELHFCAHHGRQYDARLREVAILIHDESGRLTEAPAATTGTLLHPCQRWS
jgi:hypothetical protein